MESTDAGTASRLSSETIPAWVYWAIISPESTPDLVREERRQALRAGRVQHPVGAPLGDAGDVGDRDGQEVQHARRPGHRGSCRWIPPGRPAARPGLSMALASSRPAIMRGVAGGVAGGAVHRR